MESDPTCAFCEQRATAYCRHCGRSYCDQHGGAFCTACSDPASTLPSALLFRVAFWALPVFLLLGVWFLIGTPRLPGQRTARPAASPAAGARPPSPSVGSTATATPAALDYTVKQGDTLNSIAAAAGVTTVAIERLNPTLDPSSLPVGQVLHLPAKSP